MAIDSIGIGINVGVVVSPKHPQVQFGLEDSYGEAGSNMRSKIELDERPLQAIAAQLHLMA